MSELYLSIDVVPQRLVTSSRIPGTTSTVSMVPVSPTTRALVISCWGEREGGERGEGEEGSVCECAYVNMKGRNCRTDIEKDSVPAIEGEKWHIGIARRSPEY